MRTDFILIAAGKSLRMGQDKAQLDFHGRPWIFEQAKQIQESQSVDQLVLVTQSERAETYRKILEPLKSRDFQIEIIENPNPDSKPSDSIRCALMARPFPRGALISPIDVCQKANIIQIIAKTATSQSQVIKPTFENQKGHPIWMSQKNLELFLNSPEERLDYFLAHNPNWVELVKVEYKEILTNLNTMEAWRSWYYL